MYTTSFRKLAYCEYIYSFLLEFMFFTHTLYPLFTIAIQLMTNKFCFPGCQFFRTA